MRFPKFLKIAVVNVKHMMEVQINQNKKVELKRGSDVNLLKDLSQSIGFEYEIYLPKDETWGAKTSDGNWTGALGMLDRGEVDVAFAALAVNEDRHQSFSQVLYSTLEYGFVSQKPRLKFATSNIFSPFQAEVWILCLISVLAITGTMWLTSRRYSLLNAFIKVLKILLHQDCKIRSHLYWVRIVASCWMVTCVFLTFSYSAVLLSCLTLPGRDASLRTLDQLSDAVLKRGHRFLIPEGSAMRDMISQNSKLKTMGEFRSKRNWTFSYVNGSPPLHFDSKTVIAGPMLHWKMMYGDDSFTSKAFSMEPFATQSIGFAVMKNFCCIETLRKKMDRISAAGLYNEYVRRIQLRTTFIQLQSEAAEDASVRSLTIHDLREIFICEIVGIVLAFMVLIVEVHYQRLRDIFVTVVNNKIRR